VRTPVGSHRQTRRRGSVLLAVDDRADVLTQAAPSTTDPSSRWRRILRHSATCRSPPVRHRWQRPPTNRERRGSSSELAALDVCVWTLQLPALALGRPTRISMTSLANLAADETPGRIVSGVLLEPDGLRFALPDMERWASL